MLSLKTAQGENPALSYRNLRAIIGYVGLALPAVLLLAGLADGHIESSISAYYYTKVGHWPASPPSASRSSTPLRGMPR